MAHTFRHAYPIRFTHCDPAGIVYFPHFFDFIHRAIEDFFTHGLGHRFADLIVKDRSGVPTVQTNMRFLSPARIGDNLEVSLTILKLGRSSINFKVEMKVDQRVCVQGEHVVCLFSQPQMKSIPIPDALRQRMQEYVLEDAS
jgi:4-hydroxybenzoyl-CoA thioesterase